MVSRYCEVFGLGFKFVARLEYLNMLDIFIDERPRVQEWWALSKELSSYKKAIPEMLDEEDVATMRISGTKIRDKIRARRAEGTLSSLRIERKEVGRPGEFELLNADLRH